MGGPVKTCLSAFGPLAFGPLAFGQVFTDPPLLCWQVPMPKRLPKISVGKAASVLVDLFLLGEEAITGFTLSVNHEVL